jgi:hypothetical protein
VTSQADPGFGFAAEPDAGQAFGVNAAQVLIYLDELGQLDLDRAIEVWDSYAVAAGRGYAEAREAAEHVAHKQRPQAWARARAAATAVVSTQLGQTPVSSEVEEILATVAGSLVIRDLLSRRDFRLLQLPWAWSGKGEPAIADGSEEAPDEAPPEPAAVVLPPIAAAASAEAFAPADEDAPVAPTPIPADEFTPVAAEYIPADEFTPVAAATRFEAVTTTRAQPARRTVGAGVGVAAGRLGSSGLVRRGARAATVIITVLVLAFLTRLAPDGAFVGPADTVEPTDYGGMLPGPSPIGSAVAVASQRPGATPTPRPSTPGQTQQPGGGPTPGPGPTQPPAPTPRPTPRPNPTPQPMCTVISLVDLSTVKAQSTWAAAGFTGTVQFSPDVPPQYRIVWQSLAVGASVTCGHGITVSNATP